MLQATRRARARRQSADRAAEMLIEIHGRDAWLVSRDLAHRSHGDEETAAHWWRVVHRVEGQLGLERQADTAARYLSG